MKKRIIKLLPLFTFIIMTAMTYGQAKKPTLMVVPSDLWFNKNGYMLTYDNQGTAIKVPDYKRAFLDNADLLNVISKINGLMAERGFPLKNLESILKSLEEESAEDALTISRDGGEISETPIDKLKKRAKADIIIQLTWTINKTGPKKSITFNMQGLDAYTNKQIATAQGTGTPSFSAEIPVLLEEAVLSHLDNFNVTLQDHFDDMFKNGREITLRIKTFDSWDYNLEDEFGGDELSFVIEDWLDENTVEGRYNTVDATETTMFFEQVRIPLYNEKGRAIDARRFIRTLSKKLKDEPFLITNKLVMKGLGQATLILGSK